MLVPGRIFLKPSTKIVLIAKKNKKVIRYKIMPHQAVREMGGFDDFLQM